VLRSSPGAVFQPRGFPNIKTSRLSHLLITAIALAACLTPSATSARADGATVRHVAGRIPVRGLDREMSADRPTKSNRQPGIGHVNSRANPWKLQATLPRAVIHDISFLNAKIGYAAAEAVRSGKQLMARTLEGSS
jgi:hypothetical protein